MNCEPEGECSPAAKKSMKSTPPQSSDMPQQALATALAPPHEQPSRHTKPIPSGGTEYSTPSLLDVQQLRSCIDDVVATSIDNLLSQVQQDNLRLCGKVDAVWQLLVRVEKHLGVKAEIGPKDVDLCQPGGSKNTFKLQQLPLQVEPLSPLVLPSRTQAQGNNPELASQEIPTENERPRRTTDPLSQQCRLGQPSFSNEDNVEGLESRKLILLSRDWVTEPDLRESLSRIRTSGNSSGNSSDSGEDSPNAKTGDGFLKRDVKRSRSNEDLKLGELVKEKATHGRRSSLPSLLRRRSKDSESRNRRDHGGSKQRSVSKKDKGRYRPKSKDKSPSKHNEACAGMVLQAGREGSSSQGASCSAGPLSGIDERRISTDNSGSKIEGMLTFISRSASGSADGAVEPQSLCSNRSRPSRKNSSVSESSSSSSSSSSCSSATGKSSTKTKPSSAYGSEETKKELSDAEKSNIFPRRLSKASVSSRRSEHTVWSGSKGSVSSVGMSQVASASKVDMKDLDAQHTDLLFQACGFSKPKGANMERRGSNSSMHSNILQFFASASAAATHDNAQAMPLQERRTSNSSSSGLSPTSPPRSPDSRTREGSPDSKGFGKVFGYRGSCRSEDSHLSVLPGNLDNTNFNREDGVHHAHASWHSSPFVTRWGTNGGCSNASPMDNRFSVDSRESGCVNRASRRPSTLLQDGRVSCGMDYLRAQHEAELVASSSVIVHKYSDDETQETTSETWTELCCLSGIFYAAPRFLTCAFGVLPFQVGNFSFWYANVVQLCVVLLLGYSFVLAMRDTDSLYIHLTTAFYALGGLIGAILLRMRRIQDLLGPHDRHLELYARNFEFFDEWHEVSLQRFRWVMVLWICSVISRVMAIFGSDCPDSMGGTEDRISALVPLIFFVIVNGLLSVLMYIQLHVCCGLEMAIDKFCHRLYLQKDLGMGITEWNVLQAMLRRAANTIDSCFLAQSTSVLATVLLTGAEVMQTYSDVAEGRCAALWCGWVLPPILLVIYAVFRAAAVTEKCCRVPALVNSWPFTDEQIDRGRQYVVEYINHSAAGFYVKGVRLNAFMAFKLTYLFGVVMFTLITQAVLRS